jgi:hypothetical protein
MPPRRPIQGARQSLFDQRRKDMPHPYDPRQPRVPAGHHDGGQWTRDGDSPHALLQPAFAPNPTPLIRLFQALLEFGVLSLRNNKDQQAVIAFKARDHYRAGSAGDFFDPEAVRLLDRDDVNRVCDRLQQVQALTDMAAAAVSPLRPFMSASHYGTAVHARVKSDIDALKDPNFRAEVSYLKAIEDESRYGMPGSIRIDVLEKRDNPTVCVYDIKTGRSGLSAARFAEIASNVFKAYKGVQRIIITEVRPRP